MITALPVLSQDNKIYLPIIVKSRNMRILVIGDSLSRGLAADSFNSGFAYLVATKLNADLGIMPGGSLFKSEKLWNEWQWRSVDLIIVELALHDIRSDAGLISDEEWSERYGNFLDKLYADTKSKIIVTTAFWTGVTEFNNQELYNRTLLYNDFIRLEANKRKFVEIADFWNITEGCIKCISDKTINNPWKSLNFHGDNFHPGEYGHHILAQEVLKSFEGIDK